MYTYWPPVAAARHGFKMVLFTASSGNTFVGGTCALPSALLVVVFSVSCWTLLMYLISRQYCA